MSDMIDIQGAIDMHIHSHPCLFPRIADDRTIAQAAAEAGLAAIMFKCHHESTVSRAYLLQSEFPEMKIFGGVVLNSYVGGINPSAVEAALRLGGKGVWMPTIDSAHHAEVHGSTGVYAVQASGSSKTKAGISVLKDGKLIPEAIEVIELIAKYNAILSTSHLSLPEIRLLVAEARNRGVEKILITHPFYRVPVGAENLDFLKEMVSLGAMPEFGYCIVSPMWACTTIDRVKETIAALGVEHCVIISDGGQRHNPLPHEGLRIYAQSLYEKGMAEKDVERLIKINPRELLGL